VSGTDLQPGFAPRVDAPTPGPSLASTKRNRAAREDALYRRVLALCDVSAAVTAMFLVDLTQGEHLLRWDLVAALLVPFLAKLLSLYDMDRVTIRRSTLDEVPRLVILAAVWAALWSLLTIPLGTHADGRGGVGLAWVLLSAVMIVAHSAVRTAATRLSGPERLLIIGGSRERHMTAHSLLTDPGARVEVVGFLPLDDERDVNLGPPIHLPGERRVNDWTFDDLPAIAESLEVERVLLLPTAADSDLMLEALQRITELDLRLSMLPRLFEVVGSAVAFDSIAGITVLGLRRPGLSRSSQLIKRTMDLVGASLGLILGLPLFLAAIVAIRLDSPGPAVFRQQRIGRDGRVFEMIKFRSMVDGAEAQRQVLIDQHETVGIFKLDDDPRVTRVGRFLRQTSIDELPQLLNVLRGEMSLVGPRPLVPAEDALILGRHRERLTLSPGMTGPWQVLGPTRPPLSEMVKTDYLYAITWSAWLDVKLLLRTVSHIWARRGR
jgi:exopolysaccharide biosynthesis polyprenyl glycosylphosphotransferase